MPGPAFDDSDDARRQSLEEVVGAFLEAVDAGQEPNPLEWLARHPDLGPELSEFFADRMRLEGIVAALRIQAPAAGEPETYPRQGAARETAEPATEVGTVRSHADTRSTDADPTVDRDATTGGDNGPRNLPLGTRVRYFGDYELLEELGRGAMGVVFKARQISLNRPVALKMLKSDFLASDDELRRFQNEAEAVALLDHPHILPIYEVGKHDGHHYFSMKFIGGASLDRRLGDYSSKPKAAARLVATAALAVHHAHQRGILHRDLKPSNILLDDNGDPHIADFGLAKRVAGGSELTHSGAILGTPAYMAPEQASGRLGAVTTSSDVYGLGAVLYALLTCRPPFRGGSVPEILEAVRDRAPERPAKLDSRVPLDLEIICLKCLEKDPSRRYGSAQDLADDLRRYSSGEPITARRSGAIERGWLWCKRNRWLAGAIGATAGSLLAVAIMALLYADRQRAYAAAQLRAKNDIEGLAKNLQSSLSESKRNIAGLYFERGDAACQRGEIGPGLLLLVESYRAAIAAGDAGWRHTALASLSVWHRHSGKLKAVFSHSDGVRYASFSRDGKTVLTVSEDHTAQLWDVTSSRPRGPQLKHEGSITSAAFSPDGKTVLTGSYDKTARLWDATTGRPLGRPLKHQDTVHSVAFSPDGKTVLTGGNSRALLWSATTGRAMGPAMTDGGYVISVAFSPDGKTVLTSGHKYAQLWDAATSWPRSLPMEHDESVLCMGFSADGKTVLTGSEDKTARLWDSATGRPLGPPMPHQDRVTALAFSPDGKTVLTGSKDKTARLWDVKTFRPVGAAMAHQGAVRAVAFSPNGKTVLTGSFDKTARLWDAATGQPLGPPLTHEDSVFSVAFSPDGKTVLTGSDDKTARLWEPTASALTFPLMNQYESSVAASEFSPDGRTVLTTSDDGQLWDATTGRPLGAAMRHQGQIYCAAFSPDGKTVLTGSYDNTARLWDATTGRPIGEVMKHQDSVGKVAFSRDGKALLTWSGDKTARRWDATTGRPLGPPVTVAYRRHIFTAAFSPDLRTMVIAGPDNTARLWDTTSGQLFGAPLEHQEMVHAAVFSPDGKAVWTGSADSTARVWDATTGRPLGPPLAHRGGVGPVALSQDGKTLLTSSGGNTARLWHPATGQSLGTTITIKTPIDALALSPDGKTVLIASYDDTLWKEDLIAGSPRGVFGVRPQRSSLIQLWQVATGRPLGPALTNLDRGRAVKFSPDGRTALVASQAGPTWLCDLSELPDDPERVATWAQVVTGLELDEVGSIRVLDNSTWRQRRERLEAMGRETAIDRGWLVDPVLFGPDAIARARAWLERGRQAEAEAALIEALHARPLSISALFERDQRILDFILATETRFRRVVAARPQGAAPLWTEHGDRQARKLHWSEAAFDFGRATSAEPYRLHNRNRQILSLLLAGDHAELGRAVLDLLDWFRETAEPTNANSVAWYSVLGRCRGTASSEAVRLAELAVTEAEEKEKSACLNTLGAALYRAGRFEEAIKRLDEGIRKRRGESGPEDWVFMALAHDRLGRRDAARRWLDRFRDYHGGSGFDPSDEDSGPSWGELEVQLLRGEAEAAVLWDPIFPADPFAH
jgi:WD40 repeat protein/tetratricopeptide (TPR) repeat protein